MKAKARTLTQTLYYEPLEGTGKSRTSWPNYDVCAHQWAGNRHSSGRAGRVYFEGATIYSYGGHFPIARHVLCGGEHVIFFTTEPSPSSSTSHHLSSVASAIPRGFKTFHVRNVRSDRVDEHIANMKAAERDALLLVNKAAKARQRKSSYMAEAAGIIRQANEYAAAVGLNAKHRIMVKDLEMWGAAYEEQEKKRLAAEEKSNRRKMAAAVAKWEGEIVQWQNGGDDRPRDCPDYNHPLARMAFLCVKGRVLETSMRMAVPLRAVMPILKAIRTGKEIPEGFEVEGFRLERVQDHTTIDRCLRIGCHTVNYDEIERAAKLAGL